MSKALNLSQQRRAQAAAQKPGAKRAQEALAPQLFALTNTGDPEDGVYRRITSPATLRDLNPFMQQRMQQVCFYLKATTPFGKRIVEVITSYVVGKGFKVQAEDETVQQVLDKFWNDPINNMDATVRSWCDEETTFGELCIPVAVNPVNGFVRMAYIDPQEIDAIEYGNLTTGGGQEQIAIPVSVRIRQRLGEAQRRRLALVRPDEDPNSETYGRLSGECFYFAINKAKAASRGISELFSLADWVDVFDQMIFDFADKVRFLNSFVWDYTIAGADEKAVEEAKKKIVKAPPRQGGVQVHNEQVTIEARTPDLKGADMAEGARMVKLYGLGGAGLPAWFFADPVDANRSTAEEMSGPTGKKLLDRQDDLAGKVSQILNFVIDQAVAHGVLPDGVDRTFKLQGSQVMVKDIQRASTTLTGVTGALSIAEDRGWVRGETAARAFHAVLAELGIEVDSQDEYAQAQQELQDRQAQQQDQLAPQKALADALKQSKQLPAAAAGSVN